MKKIIFILCTLFTNISLFSAQYYWMQTYPPKYALDDITSYNESEAYILGHRTNSILILKSDTLGKDWKVIKDDWPTDQRPDYVPPVAFRISNPYKNYLYIGMEGYMILKSSDGGIKFDTIRFKPLNSDYYKEPMNFIRGLHMADTNVGIASTNIYLYITKDGWRTYETHSTLNFEIPEGFHISFGDNFSNNVHASDKDNFISNIIILKSISKYESIRTTGTVKTTDGGKTWHLSTLSYLKEQDEPTNYISSFYFHDNYVGWAIGSRSNEWDSSGAKYKSIVFKTTDGGLTWQNNFEVSEGKSGARLLQIAFRDYKRGVVVGKNGRQFYTTDGGDTWVDESRTDPNTISSRVVQQVTFMGNLPIISTIFDGVYTAMKYHKTTDVIEDNPPSNELLIYPNPASDYITISIPELNKGLQPLVQKVQIFNTLGIEVISTPSAALPPLNEGNLRIDISNLPIGVYFIRIGDKVEKFVKM